MSYKCQCTLPTNPTFTTIISQTVLLIHIKDNIDTICILTKGINFVDKLHFTRAAECY